MNKIFSKINKGLHRKGKSWHTRRQIRGNFESKAERRNRVLLKFHSTKHMNKSGLSGSTRKQKVDDENLFKETIAIHSLNSLRNNSLIHIER